MAQTYTYDSFGNTTNSSGSLTNFLQYTGREFDSETGLYYYRARYYDATVGRFLSEDPIRLRGGKNFYRYVHNSTPNLSDPTGLSPITVPLRWTWGWVWGGVEGGSVWLGHAIGAGFAAGLQMTLLAESAGSGESDMLKRCKKEPVTCWLSGEFKDPSVDPKFKMCSYSCSDGTSRVWVIHIVLPCPKTPERLSP